MKTKEFKTLTEKIRTDRLGNETLSKNSVKEFIKRLKEELSNPRMFDDAPIAVAQNIEEHINKLAGDKLTKEVGEEW